MSTSTIADAVLGVSFSPAITSSTSAAVAKSSAAVAAPIVGRAFVEADYLAVGNGSAGLNAAKSSLCAAALNNGFASCAGSPTAHAAGGFRVGYLQERFGMGIGGSIGYLYGGPGAGKASFTLPGDSLSYRAVDNTVRALVEARKTWRLLGGLGARVGAGLGAAVVTQTTTCSDATGALPNSGSLAGINAYSTLAWFTWEISPALVYRGVSLGVRAAGFARGAQTPWNTTGAFLGVDF